MVWIYSPLIVEIWSYWNCLEQYRYAAASGIFISLLHKARISWHLRKGDTKSREKGREVFSSSCTCEEEIHVLTVISSELHDAASEKAVILQLSS